MPASAKVENSLWPGLESLEPRMLLSVSANLFDVSASSYLGGSGDDGVRGVAIQSDGTVVLAANIGDAAPGGLTPTLLNGASVSSPGAIVRLSADGSSVLSVTRLADRVLDLSVDDADNLHVALWDQGFAKLDASASTVLYSKTPADLGFANVQRIDTGPLGTTAVLGGGSLDSGSTLGDDVKVYDPSGTELGGWSTGKWKNDIAIDEASETVIYLGYRNATDQGSWLPVQISYYRGRAYDGTIKYTGYDFSTDPNDPNYLNAPTNNMADTRGYRCEIGEDGLLYMGFESAGGNFLFRYDPFDVTTPVTRAGGDAWNSVYNIQDQHITVFGRYQPADGAYLAGQELVCRLDGGGANTCRMYQGNIAADADGRVYLTGSSAWGLPLASHPSYTFDPANPSFNPGLNGNYLGGAYLVAMESSLVSRDVSMRLAGDWAHGVAVRTIDMDSVQLAVGGQTASEAYLRNADQAAPGGGEDGWYSVIADSTPDATNGAPLAAFSAASIASGGGTLTLELDASASSDPDTDPLDYRWYFGDGTTDTGALVQHVFDAADSTTVTLTVLDGRGGWSHEYLTLGPPSATFSASPRAASAPTTFTFDASGTTDPNDQPGDLTYAWDFGDGTAGSGMVVDHTYERGGVYEVTLTVTDPFGGMDVYEETYGVARRGGFELRLDFETSSSSTAPGYTHVPLAEYTPEAGFGWQEVTGNYTSGGYTGDALFSDYHAYSKYPSEEDDGTFLVDVPDGEYTVLARFSHKDDHWFPGMTVDGVRRVGAVRGKQGLHVTKVFKLAVDGGQAAVDLIRPYWFISGLEIIDIGPALTDTGSFVIDPDYGEAPMLTGFDASGYADASGLTYSWTFGDGQVGGGETVWHEYDQPGLYTATLTVSGAGTSGAIVDFGGDYGGSKGISGLRADGAVDADGDGLDDDTAVWVDFSTEPDAALLAAGGTSGRVYGGMASYRLGNPAGPTGFADFKLSDGGANDYINVRDQVSAEDAETHISRHALLWIKDEFLGGAHAQQVSFDASSSLGLSIIRWENLNAGRFLVADGEQLYASQATFSGSGDHALDPSATLWAPYDPSTPYGMDFDQDTAVFASHSFTDVQAVGVLLEQDGADEGKRVWYQIDGFEASAAWGPASATVEVIEPLPRVSVTATDPDAAEQGQDTGTFTITRTGATDEPLTVNYVINGSAGAGEYVGDPELTGSVEIPAGSASVDITITPYDDLAAEGDETVEISLTVGAGYYVEPPADAIITIADDEVPFVDFGGDYLTSTTTLKPGEGGGAGTLTVDDFDGDGLADDARRAYTYSLAEPISPAVQPGVYEGSSATFYGGVVGIGYDSTSENFDSHKLSDHSSGDRVSIRFQTSETSSVDLDTLFLWLEEDFLVPGSPKKLGGNSTFELHFNRFERLGTGRWVLGDGTNLYVSQATFGGGGTTWTGPSLADSMWASYTPTGAEIDFDQASAVFDVPISAIDVRAVGFLTDADGGETGRYWIEFDAFSVEEGDNTPPTVTGWQRTPDPASRPDQVEAVAVTFSEDVVASVGASDLALYDQTREMAVDLSVAAFSYDRPARTASWDVSGVGLEPGFYELRLSAAGITDDTGNLLDGDGDGAGGDDWVEVMYLALPGDATMDGTVDVADLGVLAGRWGSPAAGWSQADFDASGQVDVSDLGILAGAWGRDVRPPAATAEPPAASSTDAEAVDLLAAAEPVEAQAPVTSAPADPQTPQGRQISKRDRLDPAGLACDGAIRWWKQLGVRGADNVEPADALELLAVPVELPIE